MGLVQYVQERQAQHLPPQRQVSANWLMNNVPSSKHPSMFASVTYCISAECPVRHALCRSMTLVFNAHACIGCEGLGRHSGGKHSSGMVASLKQAHSRGGAAAGSSARRARPRHPPAAQRRTHRQWTPARRPTHALMTGWGPNWTVQDAGTSWSGVLLSVQAAQGRVARTECTR